MSNPPGENGSAPTADEVGGRCVLEACFGNLLDQLATSVADDGPEPASFEFSAASLPQPPPHLSTDELRLRLGVRYVWGRHGVYETREVINLEATKRTYRLWGLLILATVFHAELDPVTLELTHKDSELRQFLIGGTSGFGSRGLHVGSRSQYSISPDSFLYLPAMAEPRGWPGIEVKDLPCCWLVAPESGASPDRVVGFGSDRGSVLLAELLLNVGLSDSTREEYNLEGESLNTGTWSVRSLGPSTVDVTLWLPGAIGYLNAPPGDPIGHSAKPGTPCR